MTRLLTALVICLSLCFIAGGVLADSIQADNTRAETGWRTCRPGPWGDVSFRYFRLAIPDREIESSLRRLEQVSLQTVWRFPGLTGEQLLTWLSGAGVEVARWSELASPYVLDEAGVFRPTDAFVVALTPQQRSTLYSALAKSGVNPRYSDPYVFPVETFDDAVRTSGLSRETQAALRQLCYEHLDDLAFVDFPLLFDSLKQAAERKALVRFFRSFAAVSARLTISSASDLERVARYWGRWEGQEELLARLESTRRGQQAVELDISTLLPAFAAERLYRYPVGRLANVDGERPDCFWTAINFHQAEVMVDPFKGGFSRLLREHYQPTRKPNFGDMVVWVDDSGRVTHAAAYVADNIVYTKNGNTQNVPWLLSTVQDVSLTYGKQIRYLSLTSPLPAAASNAAANDQGWITGQAGPWGTIQYKWFSIDRPAAAAEVKPSRQATKWVIPGAASVPDARVKLANWIGSGRLESLGLRRREDGVVLAEPTDELVFALDLSARSQLYAWLATSAENRAQRRPFVVYTPHLARLLATSSLSETTKGQIRQLCYRRDSITLFGDWFTLSRSIGDDRQRSEAFRILSGHASVMARVRLPAEKDVDAFVAYWKPPSGPNHVEPLVKSLLRRGGASSIDISLLLSPFLAQRLFRFPSSEPGAVTTSRQNTFWTSGNFYFDGDERQLSDATTFVTFLRQQFQQISQPAYGDIVLFTVSGKVIHAANYIADDLVFNKCGFDVGSPWILSTLADAKAMLGTMGEVKTGFYRRR